MDDAAAYAREVLALEARAIEGLRPLVGPSFAAAVRMLIETRGMTVVAGIGKSGIIGQKLSATLASTGTPSFFLHPSEALHGDLGRVRSGDVAILLSQSGETDEVIRLIDPLKRVGAKTIGVTGGMKSSLARNADLALDSGTAPEACPLGLAPTTSTAAQLAIGDALAMTVLKFRGFQREDYARFHPGGMLGRRLMRVSEIMRQGDAHTVVEQGSRTKDVVVRMNATRGRPGAASVVDAGGVLVGFFTDGDLARGLQRDLGFLEAPIDASMKRSPTVVAPDALASEALQILRDKRIDQLPVVDPAGRPVGLLDVQDLMAARII
jgi:arabinose-5-phosphate isomerase